MEVLGTSYSIFKELFYLSFSLSLSLSLLCIIHSYLFQGTQTERRNYIIYVGSVVLTRFFLFTRRNTAHSIKSQAVARGWLCGAEFLSLTKSSSPSGVRMREGGSSSKGASSKLPLTKYPGYGPVNSCIETHCLLLLFMC